MSAAANARHDWSIWIVGSVLLAAMIGLVVGLAVDSLAKGIGVTDASALTAGALWLGIAAFVGLFVVLIAIGLVRAEVAGTSASDRAEPSDAGKVVT